MTGQSNNPLYRPPGKDVIIHFRVPQALADALDALSADKEISRSDLIRTTLQRLVKRG